MFQIRLWHWCWIQQTVQIRGKGQLRSPAWKVIYLSFLSSMEGDFFFLFINGRWCWWWKPDQMQIAAKVKPILFQSILSSIIAHPLQKNVWHGFCTRSCSMIGIPGISVQCNFSSARTVNFRLQIICFSVKTPRFSSISSVKWYVSLSKCLVFHINNFSLSLPWLSIASCCDLDEKSGSIVINIFKILRISIHAYCVYHVYQIMHCQRMTKIQWIQ